MSVGQYAVYRNLMAKKEPDRTLYLAVPNEAFEAVFDPAHGRDLRMDLDIHLLVFEPEVEVILQWIE